MTPDPADLTPAQDLTPADPTPPRTPTVVPPPPGVPGPPTGVDLAAGWSAAAIRGAERPLLEAGVPLMARAAAGLAEVLRGVLGTVGRDAARPGHVLLLVGSGSNGGDALFAGAALADEGHRVTVVRTGGRVHEDGLAAATTAGAVADDPEDWSDPASARLRLRGVDVVVDGILGTGTSASPALRGTGAEVVAALLAALRGEGPGRASGPDEGAPGGTGVEGVAHATGPAEGASGGTGVAGPTRASGPAGPPVVVACDLPSGTGPDDGSVPVDVVLPAAVTVTFGACCAGLLLPPARAFAGEVVVVDIGVGPGLAGVDPLVRP